MNKHIIKKTLKQNWKPLFWYGVSLFSYTWIIVSIYPSIAKTSGYEEVLKNFPKEMLTIFGIDADFNMNFASYAGGEYLSLMFPLILGAYIASFATRFITKEIESGQISNLLSQPISRVSIYLSRVVAFIMGVCLLVVLTFIPMPLLSRIYDYTIGWSGIYKVTFMSILFALAYGGISFLFSALFSDRGKSLGISLGFFIISYLVYVLGSINKTIKNYDWLSIFKYYRPVDALKDKAIDQGDVFILLAVFIVATILGLLWFRKRDISV
ncbi:MAG: ABC transporter permease subunit [Patescibacteria group bacterium]